MAAPNIVSVSAIYGKSKGVALTTVSQDLLENPAASGKVYKVNLINVANIDGTNNADVTIAFVDASAGPSYKLANTIVVPADASLVVLGKDMSLYLEEGDKLTGLASASGDLEVVLSWEELN